MQVLLCKLGCFHPLGMHFTDRACSDEIIKQLLVQYPFVVRECIRSDFVDRYDYPVCEIYIRDEQHLETLIEIWSKTGEPYNPEDPSYRDWKNRARVDWKINGFLEVAGKATRAFELNFANHSSVFESFVYEGETGVELFPPLISEID